MASTRSINLELLHLFKQDLSFMHVNFAKDLSNLRVLKFCYFIGMLVTFFSFPEHDTSGVLQNFFISSTVDLLKFYFLGVV